MLFYEPPFNVQNCRGFCSRKVKIPYQQDGFERSYEVALMDFENPLNNQYLCVNQYTVVEKNQNKRPDVLLFVNGLPLVVIELKNATDENEKIPLVAPPVNDSVENFPTRVYTTLDGDVVGIDNFANREEWNDKAGYGGYLGWDNYSDYRKETRAPRKDDNFPKTFVIVL